jgi:hypothetical protein
MIEQDTLSDYSSGLNNSIIDSLSYAGNEDYSSIIETGFKISLDELKINCDEEVKKEEDEPKVYKTIEELKEDLMKCSKEDLHKQLGIAFQDFTKSEIYKELLDGMKCNYSHMKEYLLHLAIFNWYRDMFIQNLPEEKKSDFVDIYDTSNVETKLNKQKGGEVKAIKSYTQEEYLEEFKNLKEVEYINTNDNKPFKIINDEEEEIKSN